MKRIALALLAALLIAGQLVSPAAAAPAAQSTCGDTYVVQRGDYLTWIARYCNVSYSQLLAWNPQIVNPNYIYAGQVLRLVPGSSVPVTSSTYVVRSGDTLFKISVRFGTTVSALLALNPNITNASRIYVGQVIKLPSGTTTPTNPPTTPTGTARVTVSTLSVAPGGTVTVTATGFPANADIDYRVGKQGAAYSTAIDGKTNASGTASATITIPSSAVVNEKWVIVVTTTDLAKGTSVTSAAITIR